jgi:glycerophosphoryl diester phosphodiesterase
MKFNPKFPSQKKIPAIKPLLSDVIEAVENYVKANHLKPLNYNIETKCAPATDGISHPKPEAFVALLMDVITKANISKRTIIQSFDKRSLQVLHQSYPSIKTSYLFGESNKKTPEQLVDDLGFRPDILSPAYQLIDKAYVESCRKLKVKLIAWTVNEEKDIENMAALGVDGIISDYPNRFSILKYR